MENNTLRKVEWRYQDKYGYNMTKAWFHQFVNVDSRNYAIIELPDGHVKSVPINEICFINAATKDD